VTGIAAAVGVLLLGVVARLGPVARLSLRADQHIAAHDRTTGLTSLAKAFTAIGEPTVGVAALVLIPVILWLFRRRVDAVKALCLIGGTLALAEVGKLLINEPRPPLSLQAMAADHTPSFPSGHASTASAIAVAVIVVVAVGWRSRIAALVVGILYAVGVAVSRVYLGDHYPLDVVGGMLCAVAAAFVVTGLFRLPLVQPWLAKLGPRTR
jgi:undecaprenyl-diphosphatase